MASQNLPLYTDVVALCGDRHRTLGLSGPMSFEFSARATAVPLGVSEFAVAAAHFPIVFAVTGRPTPLAVVGLRDGENLYVNAAGQWEADTYVPGWLRRYPFITTQLDEPGGQGAAAPVLAFDPSCTMLDETGPNRHRLFNDEGAPTEFTLKIGAFCQQGVEEEARTRAFTQALHAAGVLRPDRQEIILPGGAVRVVDGFLTLDPVAFRSLTDNTVVSWFRNGWLDVGASVIASQQNWARLGNRLLKRFAQSQATG